jgi:hypothetical protein
MIQASPADIHVADLDVRTGKVTTVLDKARTWFGRVSHDGRWMSFMDWSQGDRSNIWIAPYTPGQVSPERSWMRVTEGPYFDEESAWSDDGRTLYFVSNRDGFRCIYAVGFDPVAGKVLGQAQAVLHVHGTRRVIITTVDNAARLDAAAGRLVFSVQDIQSNIWSLIPK